MGKANQGKGSEKDVQGYLEAYDKKHWAFDWARNYDAHSAGGRFQRQTGDYQFYLPGTHGVIEVKEVKHDYRLPHGNYDNPKVAKVYKRTNAGGIAIVLVLHTTTNLWRMPPFHIFRKREGGSWDLREFPTYESCDAALDTLGLFV
jgi:hypothetical protein